MDALPLLVALAFAALIAGPTLTGLAEGGFTRPNHRGAQLPFPGGLPIVAAALLALIPLALLDELGGGDVLPAPLGVVLLYGLGVAFLGLADDVFGTALGGGERVARGWRGHAAALARGGVSTGALKAAGSLGLALYALHGRGYGDGEYLLAVAVLVLATNLFNLLDLRPGRSVKTFALLGAALTIGTWDADPLWALGLLAGPVLVVGALDLRERTMLGDTGSNLVGALAGLWLVLALGTTGQAVALALLVVVTLYGEFRSISALVERTPGLRELDSIGRLR